jgi:flagellar hook-associated protein 1 FlgK
MGLSQAISSALSGLQLTQAGLGMVADNVANADTPGYTRKKLLQSAAVANGTGTGVRLLGIGRDLDIFVQRQLRTELAGANYAGIQSDYYARINQIFGEPGSQTALDTQFNGFINSLQTLATSPDSITARTQALNQARGLAQQLNSMSANIQSLRGQAETEIGGAVNRVNELLQSIEQISTEIASSQAQGIESAGLLDERDRLVGELAGLIDIRVVSVAGNQISIFTNSGVSLFDHKASVLSFDGRDSIHAQSLWSADPNERGVGSIQLTTPNGGQIDLIANKAIRSGAIASHLEMRDHILVEAQAQLDDIASALAAALSDRSVAGTAATAGAQAGFDLDLTDLKNGNTISLSYTDGTGSHKVTLVRVDDPAALPLNSSLTADPNDQVIGIDFSGGLGSVATQLNTALGPAGLSFSNPSGMTLRVLDDGAPDLVDIDGFDATVTTDTFDSGDPTLPFFVDGGTGTFYTSFVTALGPQKLGFAGRIAVNSMLSADPSRLIVYATSPPTLAGDSTRPDFLEQRLTAAIRLFAPATGIGSNNTPYSGTIVDFMRQVISKQGAAAENADRLKEGQDIVITALQTRFADSSGVNIDSEMAHLLTLQTAYGANARVLTAIKEMFDALLRI